MLQHRQWIILCLTTLAALADVLETGFAHLNDTDVFFEKINNLAGDSNLKAEFSAPIRSINGCGPRIRKAWHRLTRQEKDLYLDAVEISLERKHNVHFTALHMDSQSNMEAHNTCGFLVWHRTFTLAYENMLRSLSPRFKCITVPYWDFFRDYAKMIQGECSNMEECSEFLQEMGGGGRSGTEKLVKINKRTFETSGCCTERPCKTFCESESKCSNCLPRGDWRNIQFAPTMDYSSIVATLLGAKNYEKANKNIQRGVHDDFHDIAGGAFSTFASTSDPVFFPFHATIDMLHLIYLKCGSKRDEISSHNKKYSSQAFVKCAYRKKIKAPDSRSTIKMLIKKSGRRVPVYAHPVLRDFFRGIGTEYYQMIDPTDMGEFSYDYEMDHVMRLLLDKGLKCLHPKWSPGKRKLKEFEMDLPTHLDPDVDATDNYWNWYQAAHPHVMKKSDNDFVRTAVDLEVMTCTAYNERFSERQEFSQAFKDGFNKKGNDLPRCRSILNDIESGVTKLQSDWKTVMHPFV